MHAFTERIAAAVLTASFLAFAGAASAEDIKAPESVAKAGKIVFCSDISGPPLGYFDENNQPIGSDIELGQEIAKRLGVKAEFANTPFDGIIPALQAKGYNHRFIFTLATGHCDKRVFEQTLADTLVWVWRGYHAE